MSFYIDNPNQITPQQLNDYAMKNESFEDSFYKCFQFNVKNNSEEEEEEVKEIENKIYYIEDKTSDTNKNTNTGSFKFIQEKRKRGRETTKTDKKNIKIHNRYTDDNLLRKIQVHYIKFILSFINEILKKLNYYKKFLNLDYKFKKIINKDFVQKLKMKNLGEIISEKISPKYKTYDENSNKVLYEQLREKEVLKNIFSENYINFLRKIYYKSKRNINLKEYGLNKEINISNEVKMFDDLLKKYALDEEYKKKLNECVINNFLPDIKFVLI